MSGLPLVILKTGEKLPALSSVSGDFEHWIQSHGGFAPARIVDPRSDSPLPAPDTVGGVIITGSSAMVTDNAPWMQRTGQWLLQLMEQERPILGICFGHQLLAHILGGKVDDNPRGVEVGSVSIHLEDAASRDPLLGGLSGPVTAQASHRQCVLELPPGATLLASTSMDDHHGFRYGDRVWGLQFHPEFTIRVVREYIGYYNADLGEQRSARLLHSLQDGAQQHLPLQNFRQKFDF